MATTQIGRAGADEVAGAGLIEPLLGFTFDDVLLDPAVLGDPAGRAA